MALNTTINHISLVDDYFKKYANLYQFEEKNYEYLIDKEDYKSTMIEFAKLHVEAALELAAKQANLKGITAHNNGAPDKTEDSVYVVDQNGPDYIYEVNKESIINAYSKSNIK